MELGFIVNGIVFGIGLSIGLILWLWQRSRSNRHLRAVLRDWQLEDNQSHLSLPSQLSHLLACQHQRQHQLEQDLETYRQILYVAPLGYLQVDDENRLLWCNPQARNLLGIQPEQQSKLRLLLEVVRSYELDHLIEQTRLAGGVRQSDWTFYPVSSDASQLSKQQPYTIRGYGLPLNRGQVGIFLENRQETILLMQQRDRWASDVAHELKTPLTSIRLVAETLQSRLDSPLRGWVDRLVSETMRLSTLVQDLLDLGQIQQGVSHCLHLKTFDLVELVQSAWINLEPLARKKQVQLTYQGMNHLFIQGDEHRLYRVLINLLDNAIKYSPPWETILVKLSLQKASQSGKLPSDQYGLLEVIDAGSGFAEQDLPHVFERFYRADPARSRYVPLPSSSTPSLRNSSVGEHPPGESPLGHEGYEPSHRSGSGLGLAIVKQIVDVHQGTVTAANHPHTGGAWLQVRLPLQQPDCETS